MSMEPSPAALGNEKLLGSQSVLVPALQSPTATIELGTKPVPLTLTWDEVVSRVWGFTEVSEAPPVPPWVPTAALAVPVKDGSTPATSAALASATTRPPRLALRDRAFMSPPARRWASILPRENTRGRGPRVFSIPPVSRLAADVDRRLAGLRRDGGGGAAAVAVVADADGA